MKYNKLKWVFIAISFFTSVNSVNAQAKKPSLMVVPSEVWCNTYGFVTEFDDQGTKKKIPDIKRALAESAELTLVISTINTLFTDRGYNCINASSAIKDMEEETAEEQVMGIAESPVDKLRRFAKADIIIEVTWTINKLGPNTTVTYIVQAIDAYTSKQVAGIPGTTAPSSTTEVNVLLREALVSEFDNFTSQLQTYFQDIEKNGREVSINVLKYTIWENDLESEYDGKELNQIIEDWMYENTVNHVFEVGNQSETRTQFKDVRIPLYDIENKALDTRTFVKQLQKFLKQPPYLISSKIVPKGLGGATIILGYSK